MGYQYKVGGHGNSEVILTDEDEYGVFLERVQKAPKGTGVLVRPTSTVRSLLLVHNSDDTALSACEQNDFRSPYSEGELENDSDPGYGTQVVLALDGPPESEGEGKQGP